MQKEDSNSPEKELKEFEDELGSYLEDGDLKDSEIFKESLTQTPLLSSAKNPKTKKILKFSLTPLQCEQPSKSGDSSAQHPLAKSQRITSKKQKTRLQALIESFQVLLAVNKSPSKLTRAKRGTSLKKPQTLKAVKSNSTHCSEEDLQAKIKPKMVSGGKQITRSQLSKVGKRLTSALDLVSRSALNSHTGFCKPSGDIEQGAG